MSNRSISLVNWQNPVNWNHPLNKSLVSWWMPVKSRNGFGSLILRDLCKRYTATLEGGSFTYADWQGFPGSFGSLRFQGSPDRTYIASIPHPPNKFSISAWFTVDVTTNQKIVFYGTLGTTSWTAFVGIDAGKVGGGVQTTGGFNSVTGTTAVVAGVPYFATLSWNGSGSTATLSVNGSQEASAATTGTLTGGSGLEFGRNNSTQYFEGNLASVRFSYGLEDHKQMYKLARQYYPGLLNRHSNVIPYEAAGGGGGSSIAAISRYYRQMRNS